MPTNSQTSKAPSARYGARKIAVWPVNTEQDYEKARSVVDKLIVSERPGASDSERLEIFLTLMEAYERERPLFREEEMGALEALRYLMEQRGMSASDLGRLLGNRSLGSAILRGRRDLSKAHILRLCEFFRVSPGLFLR